MMVGVVQKWTYPPWPNSQFSAEVEHFKSLKTGERYDLFGLRPGRANHGADQAMRSQASLLAIFSLLVTASPERCAARQMDQPTN